MADRGDLPQDLTWYQERWEELMSVLSVSTPDAVTDRVRELQISVLDEEAEALENIGLTDAEEAKAVLRRTFDRLQTLRRKNQILEHVQEAVGAERPSDVIDAINALQERAETAATQQGRLADAGVESVEHTLQATEKVEQQLAELYREKDTTAPTDVNGDLHFEGDTFEHLQTLLAREEKLQRELGVSDPDAVLEMVKDLTRQLEALYRERDPERTADSVFGHSPSDSSQAKQRLEEELGLSDPEAVITMMDNLTTQLNELYNERERFADLDLNGPDAAVEMVKNMQHQLELLYEGREKLSAHELDGIDHALSVIDSMEAQLNELYDERQVRTEQGGIPSSDEAASQLAELEENLASLSDEKESLREQRNRLQNRLNELEDQVGLTDPEAISSLIDSLEAQLAEVYEERDAPSPRAVEESEFLLSEEDVSRLEDMDATSLNSLPVGVFCVDERGIIRRANEAALHWPDAEGETSDSLIGTDFFEEVAPGTKNALFRGRFDDGSGKAVMNEQFHYTYVSSHTSPTNLAVQFHSKPNHSVSWILFRVLERYS